MHEDRRSTRPTLRDPASSLFKSKLRAPPPPDHYVRRQRLVELLDDSVTAPLTLVVAPAGAGKTSLLAGWIQESTTRTAWLSLDESDRDDTRFWTGMVAALEALHTSRADDLAALFLGPVDPSEAVRRLLDDLDSPAQPPAVLVIDDLYLADDTAVAESLTLFLVHLPAWLHVVLLSRRDPQLPLDRLRARGQLREVRFAELRFVSSEAEEMLSKLVPTMTESQVADTATRTHGWAAGLHLAALAVRAANARDPAAIPVTDADLMIENYVLREVLHDESSHIIDVLADVAVVERVEASLAATLTGRADAIDVLLEAEARGLFVTRIDTSGWFEMHPLMREVLLAQLSRRAPERLTDLRARAARWFEEADETPLALEQWLRASQHRHALRLLAAKNIELYDQGQEATIRRTIAEIPMRVAMADLRSMLDYAWCHVLVSRQGFLETVERIGWWADRSDHVTTVASARLAMLRSIAATTTGDWRAGQTLAGRTMDAMGPAWWRDPVGRFGWNTVARAVALCEEWDDTSDRLRAADLALSASPELRLGFEGSRALGEALAGRPVEAVRVASGVRRSAAIAKMTVVQAELATAEALAHRELGDRARAVAECAEIAATTLEPALHCRVLAQLHLAEAHTDDGDLPAAREAFDRAQNLAEPDLAGSGGRTMLARVAVKLAIAAGEPARAFRWADQIPDPFWRGVSTARAHLAEGRRADAAEALESAQPRCARHDVVRNLLLSRVAGTHDDAVKYATAAAEEAAAHGMVQTVASEGKEIVELIERAAWRVPQAWLSRVRVSAVPNHAEIAAGPAPGAVEPLTQRERDVLRFLPSRLSIAEIADELYISVNTLKFHVKVIYRKLGVRSRAEAVEVARSMIAIRR